MMVAFLLPYGMDLVRARHGRIPGDGGLYDWDPQGVPGHEVGRARLVVLLDQLSAVDGLARGRVSGAAERAHGAALRLGRSGCSSSSPSSGSSRGSPATPCANSILILNISAAIKMLLALTVGVLGIVYVARSGFVNDMAPRTFLPGFDLHSLSYISVIIFNFLGFEVVCTYADNMRDPKRRSRRPS